MPTLDWLNPFSIVTEDGGWDTSAFAAGLLITFFIYWGWDTTAAVNEESANPTEQPGRATVASVFILVGTYLLVTIAAQALHGAEYLADQGEGDVLAALANEVLGSPLDKLMIIAVLTSAAASTQTTILPTARTALSMGAKGALPGFWANMHPRFLTPTNATIWMGILSVLWYVGLKLVSENVYYDALTALGLMIAFYYGLTGYASAIYYRKVLTKSARNFVGMGVLPLAGGLILTWAFVQSIIDLADPAQLVHLHRPRGPRDLRPALRHGRPAGPVDHLPGPRARADGPLVGSQPGVLPLEARGLRPRPAAVAVLHRLTARAEGTRARVHGHRVPTRRVSARSEALDDGSRRTSPGPTAQRDEGILEVREPVDHEVGLGAIVRLAAGERRVGRARAAGRPTRQPARAPPTHVGGPVVADVEDRRGRERRRCPPRASAASAARKIAGCGLIVPTRSETTIAARCGVQPAASA